MEYLKIVQDLDMYGVNYFQIKVIPNTFDASVWNFFVNIFDWNFFHNYSSRFNDILNGRYC